MILCPHEGAPDRVETSTAGSPGNLKVSSVWAEWPGAISVSWAPDRDDWPRVLDAIELLAVHGPTGVPEDHTSPAPMGWLTTKLLPGLGVTVDFLHGLPNRAVLVRAGSHEPVEIRLVDVTE